MEAGSGHGPQGKKILSYWSLVYLSYLVGQHLNKCVSPAFPFPFTPNTFFNVVAAPVVAFEKENVVLLLKAIQNICST